MSVLTDTRNYTDNIEFAFKGKRQYVHGTDMYKEIARRIQDIYGSNDISSFRLSFHGQNMDQCKFVLSPMELVSPKPDRIAAEIVVTIGEVTMIGWLIPRNIPVTARYSYDESGIFENCQILEKSISLNTEVDYSCIEIIVAMTRQLHETLYFGKQGKWLFGRLDLEHLLPDSIDLPVKIQLEQNLGSRLTRSKVYLGDNKIGDIYFSLMK